MDKLAFIVPTGIGASIGGYAGDASSVAQKIASEFNLIVNPNVVNAACFSGITADMLYVEGWGITQLIKGNLKLKKMLIYEHHDNDIFLKYLLYMEVLKLHDILQ